MKYALIQDGIAVVISRDSRRENDPDWSAVPEGVFAGHRLVDGEWVAPEPEPVVAVKRPLKRWAFMAALDDYKEAIDQIIAGLPKTTPQEVEIERIIRNKWEHGAEYHFDHDDMQMMLPMLEANIPGFDAEAVWAAGEAIQYRGV